MLRALRRRLNPLSQSWLGRGAALLLVAAIPSAASPASTQGQPNLGSTSESILNPNRRVSTFDLVDGLPSLSVTCLHHDSSGVLWVGTYGGLVTFDGSDFLPPGPMAPSSNLHGTQPEYPTVPAVTALELDQEGRMWCGGNSGQILRYDGLRARPTQIDSDLAAVEVLFCAEDGTVWAGGDHLIRFGSRGRKPLHGVPLERGEKVLEIDQSRLTDGGPHPVWIATDRRLLRWTAAGGVTEADRGRRTSLFFDEEGHRWEFTGDRRVLVDGREGLKLEGRLGRSHGTVGLGGSKTAVAFDRSVAVVKFDEEAPSVEITDLAGSPRSMLRAPHGGVWLGMEPEGLLLLEPCDYQLVDIPHSGNHVTTVGAFGDHTLLIGSGIDLRLWTVASAASEEHTTPSKSSTNIPSKVLLKGHAAYVGYSSSFVEDSAGRQYVGDSSGLYLWSEDQLTRVDGAKKGPVPSLAADDGERVWAAYRTETVEYLAGAPTGRAWPNQRGWYSSLVFGGEVLYAARDDRLYELDVASLGVKEVAQFSGAAIRGLHLDKDGDLWMTTYGDGLYRRTPSGSLDHYGLREGLPSVHLGWLGCVPGPTEDSHLWMNSNAGAIVVSYRDLDAMGRHDAIPAAFRLICTPEANGREGAALDNGLLYLPTMAGVVAVDSRMEGHARPPSPPALALQSTFSGGAPMTSTRRLTGSTDLEFEFSAALFPSSRNAFIEHRLVGHDSTWRHAGRARTVRYGPLDPGGYSFEVRGRAPGGAIGPVLRHPEVVIHKRWYQRNDLRALGLLTALLVIFAAVQLRTREVVRRSEALKIEFERELAIKELRSRLAQAEESERGRIARELHDDFSQRLAAYGIAVKLASEEQTPGEESLVCLDDVYDGIESLAHDLHDLSRRLHPTALEDLGLIPALRSECARRVALAQHSVDVRFECELDPSKLEIDPGGALSLFRVAQEALSNAIKHGAPERVLLRLERANSELRMEVTDNGGGITEDPSRRPGLGLTSMRERMALVGGHLEVSSEPEKGTTIIARLQEHKPIASS